MVADQHRSELTVKEATPPDQQVGQLGLAHLRLLVAVAETGSITSAAAALGRSQPAASAMLRRIEDRLGGPLFTRSARGSRTTPLGSHVVRHGRQLLTGLDDLTRSAQRLSQGPTRRQPVTVRIGSQAFPATTELAIRLPELMSDVEISVGQGAGWLIDGLWNDEIDVAVLVEPGGSCCRLPDWVERQVVVRDEPAFLGVSHTHPLAVRDRIGLPELRDAHWLADPVDDSGWSEQFHQACVAAGFVPKVRYRGYNPHLATRLVREGKALTMFFATAQHRPGIVMRRLHGDPIRNSLVVAWHPGAARQAELVSRQLRRIYRDLLVAAPHLTRWLPAGDRVDLLPY